jgi:5-methylcytosine-specific restriction endonuclease McrA
MSMKRCTKCLALKSESEFNKDRHTKDGLFSWCRKCAVESSKKWNESNPEKYRAHQRQWTKKDRILHPEKYRERAKKSLASNPERVREKRKLRNQKYRKAHPELQRKRNQEWMKAHPGKYTEYSRNRRGLEANAEGKFTAAEWEALKKKYNYTCLRCGKCEPEIKLTPDHVLPLAKGGSNYIKNIQPLCLLCNCTKNAKHIDYREQKGGRIKNTAA